MDRAGFMLDPRRLWAGEAPYEGPIALVDCESASEWPDQLALPPCPVIALGDRAHPLAARLDSVIEPPVGLGTVLRQVLARPRTAAVIVDLLRILPDLLPDAGLVAESLAYGVCQGSGEHAGWLAARPHSANPLPGHLRVTRTGARLDVVLDRPAAGNAIDRPLRDALAETFAMAALDGTIATIRLTGAGRCFSLGAELAEFGTTRDPATAHDIRRRTLPARTILACAERLEAQIQGACVGAGLEMAAFARRLMASADAWFQLPELAMGVLPGAGGCVSLTRRIGRQRTALMILSGRRIPAKIALDWGLIDALMDDVATDHGKPDIA